MSLEELERAFELHEKRLLLMDQQSEKRFSRIEDNLLVQGEILNRLDQRLDRVAGLVERNSADMQVMQSAMTNLFQHMDAFIRGLGGGNGHETPGAK